MRTAEDEKLIATTKNGILYSNDGLRLLKVYDDIERLEVKEGVKEICPEACHQLNHLREVMLPESVTELGCDAFSYCDQLEKVSMPGVQVIGERCFYCCRKLKDIPLPDTLQKIMDSAFFECESITSLKSHPRLYRIDRCAFAKSGLVHVEIAPDDECHIMERAFTLCKKLQSVHCHRGVHLKGPYVLAGCTSLKEVEFDCAYTCGFRDVPETMLVGCNSLERIVFPEDKYKFHPNLNIKKYDPAGFETRDFNSLVVFKASETSVETKVKSPAEIQTDRGLTVNRMLNAFLRMRPDYPLSLRVTPGFDVDSILRPICVAAGWEYHHVDCLKFSDQKKFMETLSRPWSDDAQKHVLLIEHVMECTARELVICLGEWLEERRLAKRFTENVICTYSKDMEMDSDYRWVLDQTLRH